MSWGTGITFAVAVLGAVLGVINTWRDLDQSRVKLRVVPGYVRATNSPNVGFYIEATNLSAFAITVTNVGWMYAGTDKRGILVSPVLSSGGTFPVRLEPRSSVTAYGDIPESLDGHKVKSAFATTACGVTRKGKSPALKQVSGIR